MKKQTRLDRLNELSKILKDYKKYFPQYTFAMNVNGWVQGNHTGLFACAGGLAAMYKPFNAQGLSFILTDNNRESSMVLVTPTGVINDAKTALSDFFGITPAEAEWLFYTTGYKALCADYQDVTAEVAETKVRFLIQRYA